MKEAAGEANMTVITIILIGVIAAIAIPLVTGAMENVQKEGACGSLGGYLSDDKNSCIVNDNTTYSTYKDGEWS